MLHMYDSIQAISAYTVQIVDCSDYYSNCYSSPISKPTITKINFIRSTICTTTQLIKINIIPTRT